MTTLGVALITKNAAAHLDACLQAVAWADRIVVVDSGSSDDTLAIARRHGAQVHSTPDWPGFGIQKNRCIDLLDTDWVLALDADEVLSAELAQEIRAALAQPQADVYALPRLSNYCGRWMYHSGWYPDLVPRLFRRGKARYSEDLVHERLIFTGPLARFEHELLHYSFDNLSQVLDKVNSYSTAGAQQPPGGGCLLESEATVADHLDVDAGGVERVHGWLLVCRSQRRAGSVEVDHHMVNP